MSNINAIEINNMIVISRIEKEFLFCFAIIWNFNQLLLHKSINKGFLRFYE